MFILFILFYAKIGGVTEYNMGISKRIEKYHRHPIVQQVNLPNPHLREKRDKYHT
jgi:hypothetical protein